MSLFCMLNTCVGWPWVYWQHGFWAVIGFLAVCLLIFAGFLGVVAGEDEQGGLFAGVVIWLLAGLLLQALPHAATGIQFVPLLPWSYSGWIPRIISAACWLTLLIGLLDSFSTEKKTWTVASRAMLVALGLNILLSFGNPADATAPIATDDRSSVIASSRDKLAQCEKLRSQRAEALERLLSDKETLVGCIKAVGAKSKKDLMAHPLGRTLVEEFEHLSRQIAQLRSEIDAIDTVVERGKSSLRSLEREAIVHGARSTDEEYKQLSDADHTLAEELRRVAGEKTPGSEVNLDKLLNEIIKEKK